MVSNKIFGNLINREVGKNVNYLNNNLQLHSKKITIENQLFDDDDDYDDEGNLSVVMIYKVEEFIICLFSNFMVYVLDEKNFEIKYCLNNIRETELITSIFKNDFLNDILFVGKLNDNDYLSVYKISSKDFNISSSNLVENFFQGSLYIKNHELIKTKLFNNCQIKNSGYVEFDNYNQVCMINTQLFYYQIWDLKDYTILYNINNYNRIIDIKINQDYFVLVNSKDVRPNFETFWNVSSNYIYKVDKVKRHDLSVESFYLPGSDRLNLGFDDDYNFFEPFEKINYVKFANKNLLIHDITTNKIFEIENTEFVDKVNIILLPRDNRILIMNFEKNYMDIYNLYGVKLYNLENLVFDQNIISNKFNYLLIFNENDGLYIVNFVNGDCTKIDLEPTIDLQSTIDLEPTIDLQSRIYNRISYLCLEYPEIYIGTNNGNIYKLGF